MKPNIENDKFFLELLKCGLLSVSKKGIVLNNKTKKEIGSVNGRYYRIGYKDFSINKIRLIQIHRLVWLFYKGIIPESLTVNHKDGNRLNNDLENLEIVTYSENSKHAIKLGLKGSAKGELNGNSKYTNEQIKELKNLYHNKKENLKDLAKKLNINYDTAKSIVTNKRWEHI